MLKRFSLSTIVLLAFLGFALSAGAASYAESPLLAELVQRGELPPVEERLPHEPLVVATGLFVLEEHLALEIGEYGGTLRMANPPGFDPHVFIGNRQPLLWPMGSFYFEEGIVGNIVRDFDVSEDNMQFTFHMREGLRWSDGEYVTTEDVRFAVEDILFNEDLTPVFPRKYRSGARSDGTPMTLEIIDEYTFVLAFDEPYGSFPAQVSMEGWVGYQDVIVPSHFMKEFHLDYTTLDALEPYLRDQELDDEWWILFNTKNVTNWDITNPQAIGFPSLLPWLMVSDEGGSFLYERNPYFFKVDAAGNQLPYIDYIRSEEVADFEMVTMRTLTGGVDYPGERSSMRDMPLLLENADRGNYNVVVSKMHRTPYTISLNLNYPDDGWREVIGDVQVRQALNMAIDRDEIIDTFYLGYASRPRSIPADYDVDEANRLLDQAGLAERDSDGYRLRPDGQRFGIHFEVHAPDSDMVPLTELIVEYWQELGIDATMRQIDGSLLGVRREANEIQATAHWISENMWRRGGTWQDYLPQSSWAPLWTRWYNTDGREGEEPPAEVKRLYQLHSDFVGSLVGSDESLAIMDEIYEVHRENLFIMNVVEYSYYPTTLNRNLRNVPEAGQWSELGIILMHTPQQWYFAE